MFKLTAFILFGFITCSHLHRSVATIRDSSDFELELQEPPMQCSKFLLKVLQPFLANLDAQQDSPGSILLNETLAKLDKLEMQQTRMESQLAAIIETLSRDKGIAPPKFERIGSRFFYIEQNSTLDWINAADACRAMGGYLAAIKNQEEFTILGARLKNGTHYWLGINDRITEGTYVSLATGTNTFFVKWAPEEPRNYHEDVDCTILYEGLMYQSNCTQYHNNYICMADDQP